MANFTMPRLKFVLASMLLVSATASAQLTGSTAHQDGVHLDGQTLDPAIRDMLAGDRQAAAEADDGRDRDGGYLGITPAEHAEARDGAAQVWISRTAAPPEMASVEDVDISNGDIAIPARIYRPKTSGVLPIIVYYHGGAWILGGIEASDRSSRQLASDAQAIVVSVDYRLAPEAPYPASWDDAEAAYAWAVSRAEQLGGVSDQVCVGGDSAGGNLAIVTTTRRLEKGQSAPLCQILYYPAVDNRPVDIMRATYASSRLFGEGFNLDRAFTDYILPRVFPGENLAQPEISPLFDKPRKMPPTLIATAGFDPLRDSQRAYAAWMLQTGNSVIYREYPTLIHGFQQHTAVSQTAVRASRDTARTAGMIAREAAAARNHQ